VTSLAQEMKVRRIKTPRLLNEQWKENGNINIEEEGETQI
jgi:hypothetical protein